MTDDGVDLTALDPGADPSRLERLVAGVMRRAGPELARRAAVRNPMAALAAFARPALAAAGLVAALSVGALALTGRADDPASEDAGLAGLLGIPSPVDAWVAAERDPTIDDLILSLQGDLP